MSASGTPQPAHPSEHDEAGPKRVGSVERVSSFSLVAYPLNHRARNPERTRTEANGITFTVATAVFGDHGISLRVDLRNRDRERESPHISPSGCNISTAASETGLDCGFQHSRFAVSSLDGTITLVEHPD